jgi:hypothetical protein
LVGRSTPPCQLAVLNCCRTEEFASALTRAGVARVVTVDARERVLDTASHTFAKHFYPAIFHGQDVQSAFESAREAVYGDDQLRPFVRGESAAAAAEEEEDILKFGLYPEHSVDHQKQNILESANL